MAKKPKISETRLGLYELYRSDFEVYAEDIEKVRDHYTSEIVPFLFRKGQKILHDVTQKQAQEQGHVRIINLKSRRYGGSTYVQGRFYWHVSNERNKNAFIITHEEEATNTIFSMAKLFQEENVLRPSTTYDSHNRLTFDSLDRRIKGLKSEYRVATAKNVHAGKSQGIHYLHVSEEAQWQGDPDELLTSLFACVPGLPMYTEIYRESTAQGFGNTFQEDTFEAFGEGKNVYYELDGVPYAWKSPKSEWVLCFIPWFCNEGDVLEFRSEDEKKALIAETERLVFDEKNMRYVKSESMRLREKFNLSWEQINWRKWCIETNCRGSLDKFHQNWPSTVEEAFLSTGSNVFDKVLCDDIEQECDEPVFTGDIQRMATKIRLRLNRHGNLTVWEKPKDGEHYFLTVDCAGGKKRSDKAGKSTKEPDRTNIDVYNHRTGNQAAQWNGHIAYDMIGNLASTIGELYFMAPACVELNNHGYTVVSHLLTEKYPQYYDKNPDEPGWYQTQQKKAKSVDDTYRAVRDGDIKINCKETVSEMRTFVEDPPGIFEAGGTNKDDRVTTLMMASQMQILLPRDFETKHPGNRFSKKSSKNNTGNWNRHPENYHNGYQNQIPSTLTIGRMS